MAPSSADPADPIYQAQARGSTDAYAAYYAGMDRSMQQKVALTTAYFPVHGVLADMGCGSGSGSFDLACLHQDLVVIGVDVAPESVDHARAHYQRPNLQYRLGDIADPLFPPESLDGILNSSVFHHLTSFNGFALNEVRRALDNQTAALKPGGVLIIRDFVIPRGASEVLLDLPARDGARSDLGSSPSDLSTAALFERFAAEWRSSQNLDRSVPYRRIGSLRPGWVRYQLSHRAACEFVLRKDYRQHWEAECREEYTYFSQAEFEAELRQRELRLLLSVELRNPWIVENRFRGRFFLYDLDERPLPFPPTNYIIVGEKVRRGAGVSFAVRTAGAPSSASQKQPAFLRLSVYQHQETGRCIELVERPNPVVDLIPWFRADGRVFVIGKQGFPRPLVCAAWDSPNLDNAHVAGYLTEPLTAICPVPQNTPLTPEMLQSLLAQRAGIPASSVRALEEGLQYFTSPGGLNERVTSYLIELMASGGEAGVWRRFPDETPNYTAFSSAGRVRPLLATQLLRAAQVGGLLDARLELNTYHLLRLLGEPLGPWIGAEIELREQGRAEGLLSEEDVPRVLSPPPRAVFVPRLQQESRFLEVRTAEILEMDTAGQLLASTTLEHASPRPTSTNTLSALPVLRVEGEVFVGLELRDLPAVQAFTGRSRFATNPAWRLPRSVQDLDQVEPWLAQQLAMQFGGRLLRVWPLGGKYYPAPGATSEVVYPLAAEVDAQSVWHTALSFLPLRPLLRQRFLIEDGHLLIALWRLSHAVGLLMPAPLQP